jgi:UDP-2,3-diacylglucosamine hydrolase
MKMGKKIYFASDFHLGAQGVESSFEREKIIVDWLNSVQNDAQSIYLLGDIFDFWFEYKYVVPKNYIRLFAKLAELKDNGIEVFAFTGNHDMWTFGYWEEITGMKVFHQPIEIKYNNKLFYIGHGDGLGPGDYAYKALKKMFRNRFLQWCLARVHPNLTFAVAQKWSAKSRINNIQKDEVFKGKEKEFLYQYCVDISQTKAIDYFIFGHRHLALNLKVGESSSRYINLGEWVGPHKHYAVFNGEKLEIMSFKSTKNSIEE